MSIATLKRKTETMYNNISVGVQQFSLNGTRRTQGYVGQTSLSRHLQRTPMKGNVIRGSGGCCGMYRILPVVTSGVQSVIDCLNDPNVVKPCVLNTAGMLEKKYVIDPTSMTTGGICNGYWAKNNTVKPDSNQRLDQSDYTNLLGKKAMKCADASDATAITKGISSCKGFNKQLYRATNYNTRMRDVCGVTKPEWKYVAMPQSSFIDRLSNACSSSPSMQKLPKSSISGAPLPH